MNRRFSTFIKSSGSKEQSSEDTSNFALDEDAESKVTLNADVPLPPPVLKYKRLDHYYSKWGKTWKYRNMSSKVTVEARPINKVGDNDPWKEFCFVVIRQLPQTEQFGSKPTFKIVIKSDYLLKACKDVIQEWPGISWNGDPGELNPEIFLTFLDEFIAYRDALAVGSKSDEDRYVLASVEVLIEWLQHDFRSTIATFKKLISHGEITWDLLYMLLVPRSTFLAQCATTGEPRAFKLVSYTRNVLDGVPTYLLTCESVDLIDKPLTNTVDIGRVSAVVNVACFRGTIKIVSLDAFPIQYHPDKTIRDQLVARGRKWLDLIGIHHKQYKGVAAWHIGEKVIKQNINGRIMIDRGTFKRRNANYPFPTPVVPPVDSAPHGRDSFGNPLPAPVNVGLGQNVMVKSTAPEMNKDLSEEDLMLAASVVYGFSLSDKAWLEFSVKKVQDVEWNEEAFANLVIPSGRKALLQSLIEAHHRGLEDFDDFIKGKGQGLVINLFGPPGVGKTFSAEATAEHVKRPLYVVGAGDLGTRAVELDNALESVFDVATMWKAIVLIDEADVFLEQRSFQDLERNAMVAVFLRHLEYYRGIIVLTTNRIKAFDEAFLSRIHVALHFEDLSQESKERLWAAFLCKVAAEDITQKQIEELARRDVNGRQIKNAVRTAQSLAVARREKIAFEHFAETLDAMNQFTTQFEAVKLRSAESA